MKKAITIVTLFLIGLLAGHIVNSPTIKAGSTLPEPCLRSTLCRGLLEVYEFEEASDTPRFGAFMGRLFEPQGQNVGNAAGKASSAGGNPTENALDLAGNANSYLWSNGGSGLPSTTAFWLYLDTTPAVNTSGVIISREDLDRSGPEIYVNSNREMCIAFWAQDHASGGGGTGLSSQCSSAFTASVWHYFVIGVGTLKNADGVPIGSASYINVDGASKVFNGTPIGFSVHQGSWQVRIGANAGGSHGPDGAATNTLDGKLDQLVFYGRELSEAEIDLLYNGGYRLPYPFVTE